jgi:hypothetical protein
MPGFSVPFGGCVGAREADGVDLSESAAAESVTFFLSPADCAGTGVEGRGECAAPFYRDLVSAYPSRRSTALTLETTFAGAHKCSRFLRLA